MLLYNVRDRLEPYGTCACISPRVDISPSTKTHNYHFENNELISVTMLAENCNLDNLYNKPGCDVVSNASLTSKNTAAIDILLLIYKVTLISLIY
jgi:hypothetical protein